jgi:GxxExxY protein
VLAGDLVVVEVKSVACVKPVHRRQLLAYPRNGGLKLNVIFNFNVAHFRDGIIRIANGL